MRVEGCGGPVVEGKAVQAARPAAVPSRFWEAECFAGVDCAGAVDVAAKVDEEAECDGAGVRCPLDFCGRSLMGGGERLRPKSMRQHLQGQLDEGVEVPQSDVGRAGS